MLNGMLKLVCMMTNPSRLLRSPYILRTVKRPRTMMIPGKACVASSHIENAVRPLNLNLDSA